jgi:FixJ family two-component response regulator
MALWHITVIDGDPAVRDSLATLMGLEELAVSTYPTAAAFLRDAASASVDCVICEAELPDRSGLELFQAIRERQPGVTFALLVSRKDPQLLERARLLGIKHLFFKPLMHRSLIDFVHQGAARAE